MPAAWSGTLGELHRLRDEGRLAAVVRDGYESLYGSPSDAEACECPLGEWWDSRAA